MNCDTALYRKSFLTEDIPTNHNIRPEILESWIRSKKVNIDPYATILPTDFVKEAYSFVIEGKNLLLRETSEQYTTKLYELMANTGSVIFYVDSNLIIVHQRGNNQLINKLASLNLCIGANLNENVIGTNAAALSALYNSPFSVIGSEHYIDALQDFACTSFLTTNIDGGISNIRALFVTPISNYNEYQFFTLELFFNLVDYRLNFQWRNTELLMLHELANMEHENKGLIFVDSKGYILKTNSWVVNHFQRETHSEKFLHVFPELNKAAECLQTSKSIQLHEVSIEGSPTKNNIYFINSEPIKKEEYIIGMIVTLYTKKYIYKNITRICNLQAHFVFNDLIGSSTSFVATKTAALKAAHSPSNTLITGESGTGKELFAQAIHNASNRKNGPFIPINCAAIPRELIGSELFGYTEGAFTGARKGGAPGKFELADKGTIFLDEIGEMPLDMQAVLLRVLEEKMVTRLGSSNPVSVDVKIISATNKHLWESVVSKEFRLDLYYRLNVIKISIPPLRERKEDIPLLINHFIKQLSPVFNKSIVDITPEALELLKSYYWPGNVRELRNIIERGLNQCNSSVITKDDLPSEISVDFPMTGYNSSLGQIIGNDLAKKNSQRIEDKKHISELMEKYNGNKTLVAKELGISRVTLYKKLEY